MADYSEFFPSGGEKAKDYSEFFPGAEVKSGIYRDMQRQNQEAQDRAVYSPAVGMSSTEAALVAAGRGLNKLSAGIQRPFMRLAPALQGNLEALQADQAERKSQFEPVRQQFPMASAVGEALPYAAVPQSIGPFVGSGIVGGLEALKYGTPQERATSGVIGFGSNLVGNLAGKAAGSVFQPFQSDALNATKQAGLQAADTIGFKPRLSQTTGSPFWAGVEDLVSRMPGGRGVMQEHAAANARAVNTVAARSIGENADELTPGVLSDAAKRLGQVFEDIKALPGKTIGVGPQVGKEADDILRQQGKMKVLGQQDDNLIQLANQAKMLANARGKIDGETYQLVRSGLSTASYEATGTTKTHYGKLLEALDDSAEQSLRSSGQGALADALKKARPEYGNLKTLERGTTVEGGNASPARIAQTLRTQNPAAYREGRMAGNPLYDVAMVGENLKLPQAGSPTFERSLLASPIAAALMAGPAYAGAKLSTSPSFNWYMRNVAPQPAMGVLSQLANPPVRAIGTGGILNLLVPPIMSEYQ